MIGHAPYRCRDQAIPFGSSREYCLHIDAGLRRLAFSLVSPP